MSAAPAMHKLQLWVSRAEPAQPQGLGLTALTQALPSPYPGFIQPLSSPWPALTQLLCCFLQPLPGGMFNTPV